VAQGDLTTLANVKSWFAPPLATTTDDALLQRLVTAASQFIQTWLDRSVGAQSYTETRDGTGGTRLAFANTPVTTVSSLSVDGLAIPPAPDAVSPGYIASATRLSLRGYAFTCGVQNVTVAYTAGYAATPPEVEQACIELVALRYRERERIGHVSKSLAGETVSFSQKDMSDDIKTILSVYRRVAAL
jgi:hypothetical protein